jgi:hypothetical protein
MSRRARGEGQIRHRADGRWEGRFTTPDGRRRSVFGRTKDEVGKQLRDATLSRDRGTLAAPTSETMRAYLRTWLAGVQPSLRPMTFQSYESLKGSIPLRASKMACARRAIVSCWPCAALNPDPPRPLIGMSM